MRLWAMRKGIIVEVTPAVRARLQSIIRDRNSPQKHVWRARTIVLTTDGRALPSSRALSAGQNRGVALAGAFHA